MGKGTIRALRVIRDNEIETARDFAHLMWPDSPCWSKVYNTGYGATRGKGMWLAAGSFLQKLSYKGLIVVRREWDSNRITLYLTEQGNEILQRN